MKKIYELLLRYILILLVGFGNLFIFYKVFYPLTFWPVSFILSFIGDVNSFYSLGLIMFNTTAVNIVNACVAGSAYYLLFILAMSTKDLRVVKRLKLITFCFATFLVFNIIRIIIMTLISGGAYFESVHMFFWYFISVIFVMLIWFYAVKLFKIVAIPVYSDIKFILKQVNKSKK
jgi:hypothetical protein